MNIYTDKVLIDSIIIGAQVFAAIVAIAIVIRSLQKTIPLLKIVNALRVKGELDEKKWSAIKIRWLVTNIILVASVVLIFFIMQAMNKMGMFIFIFVIIIYLWPMVSFGMMHLPLLYTVGHRATAEVVHAYLDKFTKVRTYVYQCEFLDELNYKHVVVFNDWLHSDNKEQRPHVGDKVEIVYLKESPKISKVKYHKSFEQKYNLRIKQ